MTVNLDLRPEVEAQLVAQANAKGLSLQDYLKRMVELQASARAALTSVPAMSHEEWERGFEALIDSFPQQPVLSDEAISRDSIYTREDEL
jgi:hypothetical protein